jgi:hypothetical protein
VVDAGLTGFVTAERGRCRGLGVDPVNAWWACGPGAAPALALGTATALAGPASAAPDTTPEKVCGSGYKRVD